MTSVTTFLAGWPPSMNTSRLGPRRSASVVSIPNAYRLWQLLKDNFLARSVWSLSGVCQSLPSPSRRAPRTSRVAMRCGETSHSTTSSRHVRPPRVPVRRVCRLQHGLHGERHHRRDYFHPSTSGQPLASVTWAAGYWPNPGSSSGTWVMRPGCWANRPGATGTNGDRAAPMVAVGPIASLSGPTPRTRAVERRRRPTSHSC
jgi:hypothetical protein